jgi:beta-lactamase superfamily II metal-dependent hydrolase
MKVLVHNVDHGQCVTITPPNGDRIMIDCGILNDGTSYWWPSIHYMNEPFGLLALTNLDEDHAEDLRGMLERVPLSRILWNQTVGHRELLALKRDGMSDGIATFVRWIATPKNPLLIRPEPNFGTVGIRWYYNHYTSGIIDDTNNLSLVLIIEYGPFKMLFSGDMEIKGWRNLLRALPSFRQELIGVNVFVASHHGRESGCSTEVFDICRPEIFIISDEDLRYDTQETTDWYRTRARGIPLIGTTDRRYVYTTRNDGSLQIDVEPNGKWLLTKGVAVPTWPAVRTA